LTIRFRRRYLVKITTPIKTKRITTIATKIIENSLMRFREVVIRHALKLNSSVTDLGGNRRND